MEAFAALADPTRRQIIDVLAQGEQSVGELARRFTITQPAISQHLRTLEKAGLVRVRQEAQRRIYSLEPRGLAQIDSWLSRYRAFWTTHLDSLERALNEDGTS
jgi:DNA-binding transcriptional ArsR family regulator